MKRINCISFCLIICSGLILPSISHADTVLEYLVNKRRSSMPVNQYVLIKNDRIMVKAAGGDKNLDLLYRRAPESLLVIDHLERTLMTVNEQEVSRINQQVENVQPLLQALGDQISDLSPEQRQKWQELLGDNVPLDDIAKSSEPQKPTRLVSAGTSKITGIPCRKMLIMQEKTTMAEVCLADAAAMKISDKDAATVQALYGFYERLAAKSQGLARQFGFSLPNLSRPEAKGIPVEFRDLSHKGNSSATLSRINTSTVSPELMRIPKGYKAVPLSILQ